MIISGILIHIPTTKDRNACALSFQSTHPHGVRLDRRLAQLAPSPISIHAPTRGATNYQDSVILPTVKISIHAPTRGAT